MSCLGQNCGRVVKIWRREEKFPYHKSQDHHVRSRWQSQVAPLVSPSGSRLTVSFACSKRLRQPFLYASVFFFSFLQSSLWDYTCAACGAQLANIQICWEFFFGTIPKLLISKWLPHYCEGEIFGLSFRCKREFFWLCFKLNQNFLATLLLYLECFGQ